MDADPTDWDQSEAQMKLPVKTKKLERSPAAQVVGADLAKRIMETMHELQRHGFDVLGELKIQKGQKAFNIKADHLETVPAIPASLAVRPVGMLYPRRERY